MKHLGIDYGTKKIGLAMSDDAGVMAFPLKIAPNDEHFLGVVMRIVTDEGIGRVVLGKSIAPDGSDNPVMKKADTFVKELSKELAIEGKEEVEIVWQNEFGTSANVIAFDQMFDARGKLENKKKKGNKNENHVDDRAATLILQRYLDTNRYQD